MTDTAPLIPPPAHDLDVAAYGAVGDGVTPCTRAFRDCVRDAHERGGGRVVVPAGRYLVGSVRLLDHVELHLAPGATLLGSLEQADYERLPQIEPPSYVDRTGLYALVWACDAEHVAVTGLGAIDGQGSEQQPRNEPGMSQYNNGRPQVLQFLRCRHVRVHEVRLRCSGMWMQHYYLCEHVSIRGLDVFNHGHFNNDGLDIDSCRHVTVSDCIIDANDDAICLKSSGDVPCERITITNCQVSSFCHGLKLGTESTGGFRDITISHCVVAPTTTDATSIYGWPRGGWSGIALTCVDGGFMEDIHISDVIIRDAQAPIYIRLADRGRTARPVSTPPKPGRVERVRLSNITATGGGRLGSSITGLRDAPVRGVSLHHVHLHGPGGVEADTFNPCPDDARDAYPEASHWNELPAFGLFVRDAADVTLDQVSMETREEDARPALVSVRANGLTTHAVRSRNGMDTAWEAI